MRIPADIQETYPRTNSQPLAKTSFVQVVRFSQSFLPRNRGFTIIELLVVTSIIAILAAMLFSVLTFAKQTAKQARCISNLRQLVLANLMYSQDYDERFVPAAADIFEPGGGLLRWHGRRSSPNQPFQPQDGPLWPYLAKCGGLKECPSVEFDCSSNAFEAGCGGYGYNDDYIGGSYWKYGWSDPRSATETARVSDIRNPSRTVMFADTAMAQGKPQRITEYSFCEPPYVLGADGKPTQYRYVPSIHFRHNGLAVVAWCDGHVTTERMSFTSSPNCYGGDCEAFKIGWFGPDSNDLFDLR